MAKQSSENHVLVDQTRFRAHPVSYSVGTTVTFPWSKTVRAWDRLQTSI